MAHRALAIKIWPSGPKFPQQSLNAECLAVIAYFSYLRSRHDDTVAVAFEPAWDTSDSPTGQLPLLACACDALVSGASSIFRHVRQCVAIERDADLDSWMSDDQQADCTAWTSLVHSRATTLLDLYLFLTPDNYVVTRSTYTAFLPLYANYTIPPAHHKAAEARSSHLSVVSLLSQADDDQEAPTTALGTGKLQFGNSRVRGLAAKAGRRIALENAVAALMEPLQELLGDKRYFFDTTKPGSIDAIVVGTLHLLQHSEVPDAWVKDILESKYPALSKWHQAQSKQIFSHDGTRQRQNGRKVS